MWNRIYIEQEMIKYRNLTSALIIANVDNEEYTFWYPLKLIEFYGKEYAELLVEDNFTILLKKNDKVNGEWILKDKIEIKGSELNEYIKILPEIHIPKKLEPLKNIEPLEELRDD